MSPPRSAAALEVLVVTGGRRFARDPFFEMLDSIEDASFTHVEHPAAELFFDPERGRRYDAFLLFDVPGVECAGAEVRFHRPSKALMDGFQALLDAGQGMVFLHHAIAGWPTWAGYGSIVGARFLLAPARVRGVDYPESGVRRGVRHRVTPAVSGHPVLEGLEHGFEIEDEVYLCPLFAGDVTPLLASDASFDDADFRPVTASLAGRDASREGWSHPQGSPLVAWTQRRGQSALVTVTCGDGPPAWTNPGLRRLLANALHWAATASRVA